MLNDYAAVYIKELADGFLCQPYGILLHSYLDAVFFRILGKNQKVNGTVADLKLFPSPMVLSSQYMFKFLSYFSKTALDLQGIQNRSRRASVHRHGARPGSGNILLAVPPY